MRLLGPAFPTVDIGTCFDSVTTGNFCNSRINVDFWRGTHLVKLTISRLAAYLARVEKQKYLDVETCHVKLRVVNGKIILKTFLLSRRQGNLHWFFANVCVIRDRFEIFAGRKEYHSGARIVFSFRGDVDN